MSGPLGRTKGSRYKFDAQTVGGGELYVQGRNQAHMRSKIGTSVDRFAVDSLPNCLPSDLSSRDVANTDTTPRVRDRAYFLWEQAGRPCGREHEFWFQASREIEGDIEARKREAKEHRIVAR